MHRDTLLARGDLDIIPLSTHPNAYPSFRTAAFQTSSVAQEERALEGRETGGFLYSRDDNPSLRIVEGKLAELEGSQDSLLTTSGMSAILLTILFAARSGEHVLFSRDVYPGTHWVAESLPRWGIESSFADFTDPSAINAAVKKNTSLLFAETISNPFGVLCDVPHVAEYAKARNLLLCVDNTYATPYYFQPAKHGAPLVVESATKALNGHEDLLAGVLACAWESSKTLRLWRAMFGLTLPVEQAGLLYRGLRSLPLRLTRKSENTAAFAEFLKTHKRVKRLFYLGDPSNPQHARAKQLFGNYFGAVLAVELDSKNAVHRAVRRAELFASSADSGGMGSYCVSWDNYPTLLRFSLGTENISDLLADAKKMLA